MPVYLGSASCKLFNHKKAGQINGYLEDVDKVTLGSYHALSHGILHSLARYNEWSEYTPFCGPNGEGPLVFRKVLPELSEQLFSGAIVISYRA